jgi:hypothetical protein
VASDLNPRKIALRTFLRATYGPLPRPGDAFERSVKWDDEGATVIRSKIATGRPCLIARFGSIELGAVSFYTRWRKDRILPVPYLPQVRKTIEVNSGVFPTDDASIDRFCEAYLSALSAVDVLGVWFNRNEEAIVGKYCPEASIVQLEALNAVIRANPWTQELAGKRVLVVHPFARTIEAQYRANREKLFEDPRVLPQFELQTVRAVQSHAGAECGFPSWFDALDHMKAQVAECEFDIAIVGAGAYGLPLSAAIKEMGRQAVHMGGATQLLFGIMGRRWEVEAADVVAPLFNDHWVRPSAEETPAGAAEVEGGCYW